MFYKILKWISIVALLLVIFIVGATTWVGYKSEAYESTAVPYIKKVIPEISKWNPELIKSYMVSETLNDVNAEDFRKMVSIFSKIGKLISIEKPQFKNTSSVNSSQHSAMTLVTYTILGKYENGDATITMTLRDEGESFKIYRFNIDSMAFFK